MGLQEVSPEVAGQLPRRLGDLRRVALWATAAVATGFLGADGVDRYKVRRRLSPRRRMCGR
jgi:hypothetical protein